MLKVVLGCSLRKIAHKVWLFCFKMLLLFFTKRATKSIALCDYKSFLLLQNWLFVCQVSRSIAKQGVFVKPVSWIKFTWGLTPKLTVRPKLLYSFRNHFLLLKMFNKPDSLDTNMFDRDPNGELRTSHFQEVFLGCHNSRRLLFQGQCYFSSGSLSNTNSCRRGETCIWLNWDHYTICQHCGCLETVSSPKACCWYKNKAVLLQQQSKPQANPLCLQRNNNLRQSSPSRVCSFPSGSAGILPEKEFSQITLQNSRMLSEHIIFF